MFRNIAILSCFISITLSLSCKRDESFVPFDYVMGEDLYPAPNTAQPEKGKLHQDPTFLTTIARITQKADGYAGPGIENEYSRCDPENCDGTRLILRANTAECYLYDPASWEMIEQVDAFNECNQEPEPRWDQSNPKVFYYLCGAQLRSYNIDSKVSTTIHDFKNEFPNAYDISTKAEGDASLDRRYWCLMVEDSLYNLLAVLVYDRTADSIVGQKTSGFPDALNWVSMDMSGAHALLGFESVNYIRLYDLTMTTSLDLAAGSNAHGDLALASAGQEVWVCQNTATDYISCYDLATGSETQLIPIPFGVNTDIGLHFSGNCDDTPGWVLVSTYGSYNPPPGEQHSWMDCQLFMLELKADPRVWRLAHTQAYASQNYDGEKNYFAEAFAAINSLGTRVYWGSNWRNYTQDYTDTYQVLLPDNWTTEMP
jgi:hypothetical protein